MPDFTYNGPSPGLYPMLRDSYGVLVGLVSPGDTLEFPEAPDADWAYLDPGERERAEADRQALADAITELTAPVPGTALKPASDDDPDEDGGGEHDQDTGNAGTSSDEPAQTGTEED